MKIKRNITIDIIFLNSESIQGQSKNLFSARLGAVNNSATGAISLNLQLTNGDNTSLFGDLFYSEVCCLCLLFSSD